MLKLQQNYFAIPVAEGVSVVDYLLELSTEKRDSFSRPANAPNFADIRNWQSLLTWWNWRATYADPNKHTLKQNWQIRWNPANHLSTATLLKKSGVHQENSEISRENLRNLIIFQRQGPISQPYAYIDAAGTAHPLHIEPTKALKAKRIGAFLQLLLAQILIGLAISTMASGMLLMAGISMAWGNLIDLGEYDSVKASLVLNLFTAVAGVLATIALLTMSMGPFGIAITSLMVAYAVYKFVEFLVVLYYSSDPVTERQALNFNVEISNDILDIINIFSVQNNIELKSVERVDNGAPKAGAEAAIATSPAYASAAKDTSPTHYSGSTFGSANAASAKESPQEPLLLQTTPTETVGPR